MENPLRILLGWLFLVLLLACQKEDLLPSETGRSINLQQPRVGQISRYVLLKGEDYKSGGNIDFQYIPDTLIAEVVAVEGNVLLISEYLAPGSISLNGENHVAFADSVVYYRLHLDKGQIALQNLHFRMSSRLFFLEAGKKESLPLEPVLQPVYRVTGWKTNLPYSSDLHIGAIPSMELFGKIYTDLNIVIDNQPMREQHPGKTHIYSARYGLVRATQNNWHTGKGYGWDLLPD